MIWPLRGKDWPVKNSQEFKRRLEQAYEEEFGPSYRRVMVLTAVCAFTLGVAIGVMALVAVLR